MTDSMWIAIRATALGLAGYVAANVLDGEITAVRILLESGLTGASRDGVDVPVMLPGLMALVDLIALLLVVLVLVGGLPAGIIGIAIDAARRSGALRRPAMRSTAGYHAFLVFQILSIGLSCLCMMLFLFAPLISVYAWCQLVVSVVALPSWRRLLDDRGTCNSPLCLSRHGLVLRA
jgi:hypothetical protein